MFLWAQVMPASLEYHSLYHRVGIQVVLQLWDQELQRKWDLHLLSVQTVPAQLEAAEIYGDKKKKQRGEKGSVLALVLCNFQEEECRF